MTNNNLSPITKFKSEPNIPKTYEQFVLEEPNLTYEDVGEQKGYGPCSGCRGWDYEQFKKFQAYIELCGGGLLGTGIFRGSASEYVCDIDDAIAAADGIWNSKGKWQHIGCTTGDRQALRDKIYEYVRRHRNGEEFIYIKISNI